MAPRKWPDVVFADEADRSTLAKAAREGRMTRLGPGIYTPCHDIEATVSGNWAQIAAHEFPGAILVDRSARSGSPGHDGLLTVGHRRRRPLVLPGLKIVPRAGRVLPGDTQIILGLWLSSQGRAMIDNAAGSGGRYLSQAELEAWIVDLAARGETTLNHVRDQAREVAETTGRLAVFARVNHLIAAALATGPAEPSATPALRARAAGQPHDTGRVALFEALAAVLRDVAPHPLPALSVDAPRRALLPFYEAYFSNYIEGTEFTLDEAAGIVFKHEVPAARPQDAHDILGTYRIVSDETEMRRVPRDADELIGLLRARHRTLMDGRPETLPGPFKEHANRVGGTLFVAPDLVESTLRAGFAAGTDLIDPLARATFLMFLVSEVHPFADGNGRIARILMNAELVHAAEIRVVIPTVYRDDYLSALRGATHNGSFEALVASLSFAQRYTARIDFSSRASAEADLARTNALRDPSEADQYGIRLQIP
jgi:fido (protein-threonine AMPylation protein)